ncbi:uncharacterized protein LAJ45_04191 [Morchella importuna]|uniref:uncharacterized protein n=1 Tax=Morchella importuna TaxID=1174673 RepID=UPI001E8EDD5D|nr:uncharacterized protein LAJ45_04191 [Morchella importuna]KAH8151570.1 hypothetical protein LAJ45_04191 [Morchella importuna]
MGFFDKLHAKYELYKLEQRYTKRKRRTTFISDAKYVDGEYVYNSYQPASPQKSSFRVSETGSSSRRGSNNS